MNKLFIPLLLIAALVSGGAAAEGIDGTKAVKCALAKAASCDDEAACATVPIETLELPEIMTVDFGAKQLSSPENKRTSPISAIETLETSLILQGHQNARGWTLVIERATGRFSAVVADPDGAFMVSGGCSE